MRLHCIELPVPSPDEAGRWLESVLHFLPVGDGRLYVCGNCRLRLVTAEGDAPSRAPDKIVGLEHIALETPDAGALLRALLSKGLELALAEWHTPEDVPADYSRISLTGEMIDRFREGRIPK